MFLQTLRMFEAVGGCTMDIYQILCVFGVPGICGTLFGLLLKQSKVAAARTKALECGVQALLRAQMIRDYNHYKKKKGYAPLYAKENFENCWVQYHHLGVNGVMDGMHNEFMALPTYRKDDSHENQLDSTN